MTRPIFLKPVTLILALAAFPALAQAVADPAAIDREVAGFAGAPLGSPGGALQPVDRRLRLAACSARLSLAWYGARQDMVEVSCPARGGWKIYVPVARLSPAEPAAPVVARGEAVTIVLTGDGFALSQQGEALESGAVGVWIKVRTSGAGAQPLRAKVLRPGVVGMDLP